MSEYHIHVSEFSIVINISPKRNIWQDPAQTSQLRQWLAKNVSQFSNFKITTLWNKISYKGCILGHTGITCSQENVLHKSVTY